MSKALRFFHKGTTFFDGSTIAAGYYLFQYQAGTTTKANTYTDATKNTANSNPMTLNADGRLGQDVYIDRSMKFVLATSTAGDPPSSSIWTVDNALSDAQQWTTTSKTTNYTVTESDRDKTILVDATSGTITLTLLAASTAGDGYRLSVKKADSSSNTVVIDGNSSETIDGATTYTIYGQYDAVLIVCDGTNWHIQAKELNNVHGGSAGITEVDGALTLTDGILTVIDSDSRANSIAYPLIVDAPTSGTPAAGIGTGISFYAESADEAPSNVGHLCFSYTDVAAGTEDSQLVMFTRAAGAAPAASYRFRNTGTFAYNLTGAPTADRTITFPDSDLTIGITSAATQAEMETASATDLAVTPGRVKFSPSAAKAWLRITYSGGTPSAPVSLGVTSLTDTGTGNVAINFSTNFSSANYCVVTACTATGSGDDNGTMSSVLSVAAGSASVVTIVNGDSSQNSVISDLNSFAAFFGDV